ncbi:phage minor head protein [Citrobacter sp.]|uniref:phage minor head protein n=1 Tax=Citrobacter sp. TaxID=1896336 RepID=UPI002FCB871F
MAFKASKIRVRKVTPFGEGKPIIPNAGIASDYEKAILPYVERMIADYRTNILAVMDTNKAGEFYSGEAMDASIFDKIKKRNTSLNKIFEKVLDGLFKKWSGVFSDFAPSAAEKFVGKASKAADSSTEFSLETAGIKEPRATYNDYARNVLGAAVNYNSTLISGIQEEAHEKVYSAVMLSLTSPNPEEQGQPGIIKALDEIGIQSKNRVKLIARDQTSKLYGALGTDRMKQNGVMFFRWQHTFGTGGGKKRGRIAWRESHEKLDNEVFWIDDPDLWTVGKYFTKKGDIGIPGYAINCHCRMIPIVMPTESDWESLMRRYSKKQVEEWRMAA